MFQETTDIYINFALNFGEVYRNLLLKSRPTLEWPGLGKKAQQLTSQVGECAAYSA